MNNKISIQELANGLMRRNGLSRKDAETFVRTVFAIVSDYLYSDKIVKIKGFGTFKLISVESRASVDVNTGERIIINGYTKVTFTPDAALRDEVNKPFSQFETVILNEGTSVADMERMDLPELPLEEDESAVRPELVPVVPESLPERKEPEEEPMLTPVDSAPVEDQEETLVPSEGILEELPVDGAALGALADLKPSEPEVAKEMPLPAELLQDSAQPLDAPSAPELQPEEPSVDEVPDTETVEASSAPDEEENVWSTDAAPVTDGAVAGGHHVENQHVDTQNIGHQTVENQHIVQVLPDNPTRKGHRSVVKTVCAVILVLLLMVLSYMAGYYRCFSLDKGPEKNTASPAVTGKAARPASRSKVSVAPVTAPDTIVKDSTSVTVPQKEAVQPVPATASDAGKPKPEYPQVKGGSYEIVGIKASHQLQEGETLCNLSRKYYGSKDFVNYIAVFNGFDNPDIVPAGVKVKLPELKSKRH